MPEAIARELTFGQAVREALAEGVSPHQLTIVRLYVARVLAVVAQRTRPEAAARAVGQDEIQVQRVSTFFQPQQLAQRARSRNRQIDELDLVAFRVQPALGKRAERCLLADLHCLDHRVAEETNTNRSSRFDQIALDIAQPQRIDANARAMLLRPDALGSRSSIKAEFAIRLTRNRFDDR